MTSCCSHRAPGLSRKWTRPRPDRRGFARWSVRLDAGRKYFQQWRLSWSLPAFTGQRARGRLRIAVLATGGFCRREWRRIPPGLLFCCEIADGGWGTARHAVPCWMPRWTPDMRAFGFRMPWPCQPPSAAARPAPDARFLTGDRGLADVLVELQPRAKARLNGFVARLRASIRPPFAFR